MKKRRAIIAVSAVIVFFIAVTFILGRKAGTEKLSLAYDDTTVLVYTDFANSISATGTVESAESTFVYSTLTSVVKGIYVELGDDVEKGQLLAKLDDQKIADQIESQETSLKIAEAGSAQAIESAQDNYNQYKNTLEEGLNSTLNSAEVQVTAAYENYTRALKTYERYREALDAGENTALLTQESSRRNAKFALDMARDAYKEKKNAVNEAENDWKEAQAVLESLRSALGDDLAGGGADLDADIAAARSEVAGKKAIYDTALSQLGHAEKDLENAKNSYDLAKAQYSAAITNADHTLADYADAVESAEQAYRDALKNLEAARLAADNQLQSYANSLHSAKINADSSVARVNLNQSRVELNSTNITAPVAGTVTAVYATIGSSGSGLLFVIENVDDFIIETTVKEYDISTVAVGMPVTIKSNATGSDIYEGTVLSVAPTSLKTPLGTTDLSGDVEFAAKIKVTSPHTRLRIGMSVRLNYIIEQQANVLSVPYDAVYINQAGEQCVLALEERPAGNYLVKELAITPEMENDFAVVISGSDLFAGLRVINDPDSCKLLVGREITLINRTTPDRTPFPWG